MRELNAILDAWRVDRQAPGVLATVVHVEGSAYRRPGARMLIPSDGPRIGSISGGCLEGDVARKAAWWTAHGDPVMRVYDTTSDDDAVWEFGLGCNGVIHVLLERVESIATEAFLGYLDATQRQQRATVVGTVVRASRGIRRRVGDHLYGAGAFPGPLAWHVCESLSSKRSRLVHLPEADIFIEYVAPVQRLVIFGAGHDAMPVVAMAAALGWDVTVADVRSGYTKPEHFPGASRVVLLPPSGDAPDVPIDRETAVVLMTHNLSLDARLLPRLLRAGPAYLGVLGPKQRLGRAGVEAGMDFTCADIHSPAGLDLGGDAPECIALSIVAEIQAHRNGRRAGPLRWGSGSIHEPVEEVGQAAAALEDAEVCSAACEVVHG